MTSCSKSRRAKKEKPSSPYRRATQRIVDRIKELEELDALLIESRPPGNPPWQGLAAKELRDALEWMTAALLEDLEATAQLVERLHREKEQT